MREIAERDAEFILDLLNQPSFIQFIGDRGVRGVEQARDYIATRFTESYRVNGFGLYLMAKRSDAVPVGICGLVKRDTLPEPDIGFALLPQFEGLGYAFEAASATLEFGRDKLGIKRVLAITTTDNARSARLLEKIGLLFERDITVGDETLRLFAVNF
jgi:RimJ/RimL family protein N-acetyltransferase